MTLATIIHSCLSGSIFGAIYGLSFLISRRRVLLFEGEFGKETPRRYLIHIALNSIFRLIFLALIAAFMFTVPSINPLIMVLSFLVCFWLVIMKYKAFTHERR